MSCIFVDGKEISENILASLRISGASLLIVVSKKDKVIDKFVEKKIKLAEKLGVKTKLKHYYNLDEEQLIEKIKSEQKKHDAVIVQLPLKDSISKERTLSSIDISKDVDVLNPDHKNMFYKGKYTIAPPVFCAIFEIFKKYNISFLDKKISVVGMGDLVGKPVYYGLLNKGAKDIHKIDKNTDQNTMKDILRKSDIIISGAGQPKLITKYDIKEGAILIDAGTSSSKLSVVGDIDIDCCEKSSIFSKTPGGVGPITIACIFKNMHKLLNQS